MSRPLVSIVTPSLNQAPFIADAIESVDTQDYPAIEHLVIDGGSTDGTADVVARFDGVRFISEADQGQADAVNKGMRAAGGDVIGWLNSDDTYLPGAVAAAVDCLREHPNAVAVFGEAYYTHADGSVIEPYPTAPSLELDVGCFVCQPAVFVRASALRNVGYLDSSLHYCMDYDLWIRLSRIGTFAHKAEPWATSRLHAAAKSVSQQLEARSEVVKMTFRHFGATPLPLLYGYADALSRDRLDLSLADRSTLSSRCLSGLLSITLAARYHRRISARDWALVVARLRAADRLTPATLPKR